MSGPCRVVRHHGVGRVWDVYCDDIGDYLATMNPSLPVSSQALAERICEEENAKSQAREGAAS